MQSLALDLIGALRSRAQNILENKFDQESTTAHIRIKHVDWWSRCIPLSHGIHSTGYSRTWPGQALLPVESRLEHAILKALTECDACTALATQPVTVHYLADAQPRSYTPDILAAYVCPATRLLQCFLIEVKTTTHAERHRFKLQERQRAVLEATGLPLVVITDSDLKSLTDGGKP
jgi:hypothetical protein